MKIFPASFIVLILAFSGCAARNSIDGNPVFQTSGTKGLSEKDLAVQKCVSLCNSEKANGTNLNASPCIGNPIEGVNDWVCDLAHNPRQDIDNLTENQCSAFREGKAKHFVELDEKCAIIKAY